LKQKTGRHITKTSIGSRRVDAVPAQPLPSKQGRKERKNVPKKEDNSEIIWGRPIVPQQQFQRVEKYIPAKTAQSPIVIVTPVQDILIKKEAKKKQKTIEVKEIKIRPNIDKHDYEVKIKALSKFIDSGNKVKVSMRFRGRENEHQNLGFDILRKITEQVVDFAKVEVAPKTEGRQITMVLVPASNK
jgi:hypothetical protein